MGIWKSLFTGLGLLSGAALILLADIEGGIFSRAKILEDPPPMVIREGDKIIVPEGSPLRSRLVVTPVREEAAPHIITLPGFVEADPSRIVNILPPLTGRLVEIKVDLGDDVKEGQALAVVDSPDLVQAYSDVEKAHDVLDLARKALERAKNVNIVGANAVKDLEQITSVYTQAQTEATRAEARLKTLAGKVEESHSRQLTLFSPISGVVTALNVGEGAFITDPTAPLMTISNVDDVWVTVNVPEDRISDVHEGESASVDFFAYPGKIFHGKIAIISPMLDPDTHRNKARIPFDNGKRELKPNMYATVNLEVAQRKQVIVPLSALLMNNDTTTVFVEIAPWTFVRRNVDLGRQDDENVRVVAGLSAEDRIVTRGGVLLND